MQSIQAIDAGKEIVIGENQKIVSLLAIPAHHFIRGAVAIAIEGVSMSVPFVPAKFLGSAR